MTTDQIYAQRKAQNAADELYYLIKCDDEQTAAGTPTLTAEEREQLLASHVVTTAVAHRQET